MKSSKYAFFGASNNIPKPDGRLKRTMKSLARGAARLGINQLNKSGHTLGAAALSIGAKRLTR